MSEDRFDGRGHGTRIVVVALILALGAVADGAWGQTSCGVNSANRVAYWPADGNYNDAQGNHDAQRPMGSGPGTFVNTSSGQSWSFANGASASTIPNCTWAVTGLDYLEVPDHPDLTMTSVSIEFWVRRSQPELHIVIEKGGDWTQGQTNYGVAFKLHELLEHVLLHFR